MCIYIYTHIHIHIYLNDGIAAVQGEQAALVASKTKQEDLDKAGLVVNLSKCCWKSLQQGSSQRFDIDLRQGKIAIPRGKLNNLHVQLQQVVSYMQSIWIALRERLYPCLLPWGRFPG